MDRSKDWLRQAERDLEGALVTSQAALHEHACFMSQQAGEKALKALCQAEKVAVRGSSLVHIHDELCVFRKLPSGIRDAAKALDRHYIQPRYPNGFAAGAPADYYGKAEAEQAIGHAREIIAFCKQSISG